MTVQQHGSADAGSTVTPIRETHVKITSQRLNIAAYFNNTFFSDLLYRILPECQAANRGH
jgi:hypothetical protein